MKIRYYFFLFILLLTLSGCTSAAPELRVFWPAPPDQPRMEYLGTYASEDDFPKSGFQRTSEAVLGKPSLNFFKMPIDGVIDSKGRIYISDFYLGNVRIYDFEARTNHLLAGDSSTLIQPIGMAIDSQDRIYVADGAAAQVVIFGPAPEYRVLNVIKHPDILRPAYLCVDDSKDRLYVSDGKGSKVAIFDLSGQLLKTFGEGHLFAPQGIAVSSDGRIFVAEALMARISIFSPEGELLEVFGERGDSGAQFDHPKDLSFGPDGMLFVADARKPGMLVFDKDLQALLVVGAKRRDGSRLSLDNPAGIFVSKGGRVVLFDRLRRWFAVWQYLTPQYLAEHPITDEDMKRIEAAIKADQPVSANK